jgi:hypothetical protein
MSFMNGKIIIPISVVITIVIVAFSLTQNEIIEDQISPEINDSPEMMDTPPKYGYDGSTTPPNIQNIYDKIEEDKIKNSNLEQPYYPNEREWISSGPFKIDRSEYRLGEKIFINIDQIDKNTKGKMVFWKITNSTSAWIYSEFPFEGSKVQSNLYFTPDLQEFKGICNVDKLIGDWEVQFVGTQYSNLEFKIISKMIPGYGDRYDPIVGKGAC